ncbi:hypothetical protein FJ960_26055 [Mesorhizobium sp. B2-3-11]|uniref:phosphorylase family protein n=1 Tax=Mesorhizobium sp. B2-3-11 TaxID=2589953 RepID=UPI00112EAE36|nr:hypothetical protein [Mesorhizobium sp. B2-3-11]TPL96404.1 hypothetical protein FJ960_26055 [Mesorhizobium sp. B2-3-11]
MTDYFDNVPNQNERQQAQSNYVYNELVLRAPPLSVGASLTRAVHLADFVFGSRITDALARLIAKPLLRPGKRRPKLPDSYLILHSDLFSIPWFVRKRRLAPGHYIVTVGEQRIGVMACRRGAFEAALQADALGRLGIRRIIFVGTCLRFSRNDETSMVVIARRYSSELGRADPAFPPITTNEDLSDHLFAALIREKVAATVGDVYVAHKFVLEEAPDTLAMLAGSGIAALEMEGIGFGWGLARHGGDFAAALVPLDRFWPEGDNRLLNTHLGSYLSAARVIKPLVRAGLAALLLPRR